MVEVGTALGAMVNHWVVKGKDRGIGGRWVHNVNLIGANSVCAVLGNVSWLIRCSRLVAGSLTRVECTLGSKMGM